MVRLSRRKLLTLGLAGLATASKDVLAHKTNLKELEQPALPGEESFVRRAFALRQQALDSGDQPYGALVVLNGIIVGEAPSRVVLNHDPTAHAEIEAIRDASTRLRRTDLHGCILYSSTAACPMCEAAAYWAGIEQMISGNPAVNRGEPRLC